MQYSQYPSFKKASEVIQNSDIRQNIVKPRSYIMITRYFWNKWRPLLSNSLAVLIIEARKRCYYNPRTGEKRDSFYDSLEGFAGNAGLSARQAARLLKKPYADEFIKYKSTYRYDEKLEKRVRGKCLFKVALHDPLTPEDIHSNALQTEQPKSHTRQINIPQKVENPTRKEQPHGQNVRSIYNTCKNISITFEDEKRIEQKESENGEIEKMVFNSRRKKYENPEKYDTLFNLLVLDVGTNSPVTQALMRSCFIGEIRDAGVQKKVILDAPNSFCGNLIERRHKGTMLKMLEEKLGKCILLEIYVSSR